MGLGGGEVIIGAGKFSRDLWEEDELFNPLMLDARRIFSFDDRPDLEPRGDLDSEFLDNLSSDFFRAFSSNTFLPKGS